MPSDGVASYTSVYWFKALTNGVEGIVRKSPRRNAWEARVDGTSVWVLAETRGDAVARAVEGRQENRA